MEQDKILLKGMTFYGFHGVSPEEKAVRQPFVVDVEMERELATAGKSDNLGDTTNYSKVYQLVKGIIQGSSHNLLESIAEAVAKGLLEAFELEAVKVRVEKPRVPMHGGVTSAAVEIYRRKGKKA